MLGRITILAVILLITADSIFEPWLFTSNVNTAVAGTYHVTYTIG